MSKLSSAWDDQRGFLAVVETGSLSAAARLLGLRQATVRRRIERLEAAIGQPLFSRASNGLMPTEHAKALSIYAKRMEHAPASFFRAAAASTENVCGSVRISVPDFIGMEVLPGMLTALRARYPSLSIELALSNESADLLHQEVDVAVRMHQPREGSLVARKVGAIPLGFFAASTYLDRHGRPATYAELADHALIGPDRATADLGLARHLGTKIGADPHFVLRTDSHPAQLAAVRAGLGIGIVQVPIGHRDLERVLAPEVVHSLETWIVAHEDLRASPRIDAVFRHLVQAFGIYCRSGGTGD